ncbi:MAG: hypothetical protein NDF54_10765, partial [archaeon GB-1867-035]|nr:hypothetical protein [Candidatus Culexmicrobium profundum]
PELLEIIPLRNIKSIQLTDDGVKIYYRAAVEENIYEEKTWNFKLKPIDANKLYREILERIRELKRKPKEIKLKKKWLAMIFDDENVIGINRKYLVIYDPLVYKAYRTYRKHRNWITKLYMMFSITGHVPPIRIPLKNIKETKLIPKKSSEKHYVVEVTYLRKKDKIEKIKLKFKDYINAKNLIEKLKEAIKTAEPIVEVKEERINPIILVTLSISFLAPYIIFSRNLNYNPLQALLLSIIISIATTLASYIALKKIRGNNLNQQ